MSPLPRRAAAPTVTTHTTAGLVQDGRTFPPHPVELSYTARDPYAVRIILIEGDGTAVPWLFARDLLREALAGGLAGMPGGDVLAWCTAAGRIRVELRVDGDCSGLDFDYDVVGWFLAETDRLVPPGGEHRLTDALIDEYLKGH